MNSAAVSSVTISTSEVQLKETPWQYLLAKSHGKTVEIFGGGWPVIIYQKDFVGQALEVPCNNGELGCQKDIAETISGRLKSTITSTEYHNVRKQKL